MCWRVHLTQVGLSSGYTLRQVFPMLLLRAASCRCYVDLCLSGGTYCSFLGWDLLHGQDCKSDARGVRVSLRHSVAGQELVLSGTRMRTLVLVNVFLVRGHCFGVALDLVGEFERCSMFGAGQNAR